MNSSLWTGLKKDTGPLYETTKGISPIEEDIPFVVSPSR